MNRRRAAALATTVAAAAGAYALEQARARRWRVGEGALEAAGLTLPADVRHRFVETSDGGRVHVVERGEGPATVLVHGVMLGVGVWAPQLHRLPGRVIAVSLRGHGQSRAGSEGYGIERLAGDVVEVLAALDVSGAALVGHSMGGMAVQLAALAGGAELERVRRIVLVATSAAPALPAPLVGLASAGAVRALGSAERMGRGPLPKSTTVWAARLSFGQDPAPAGVELTCAMLDAMSPSALAGLLPGLLAFDARDRIGAIALPTDVVVGSRDVLTPPRTARAIAARVPGAVLTVLKGCGHMVMLERADELCSILR